VGGSRGEGVGGKGYRHRFGNAKGPKPPNLALKRRAQRRFLKREKGKSAVTFLLRRKGIIESAGKDKLKKRGKLWPGADYGEAMENPPERASPGSEAEENQALSPEASKRKRGL